jgi:hypothetical protein
MNQAQELYHIENTKSSAEKPLSLRDICKTISDRNFAKTKRHVNLSHATHACMVKGGISQIV